MSGNLDGNRDPIPQTQDIAVCIVAPAGGFAAGSTARGVVSAVNTGVGVYRLTMNTPIAVGDIVLPQITIDGGAVAFPSVSVITTSPYVIDVTTFDALGAPVNAGFGFKLQRLN